jgi:hypothetical protein
MLKEEPPLLETICKVTQVLELPSHDEFKNLDCLPVMT